MLSKMVLSSCVVVDLRCGLAICDVRSGLAIWTCDLELRSAMWRWDVEMGCGLVLELRWASLIGT